MAYSERLVIARLTTEAAPAIIEIPIIPITVKAVDMTFPSGCVGLVGVWFEYQDRQIWPYNLDARFRGNDQTIRITPGIELQEPPLVLAIRGINEDDTYEHTVYITIDAEFPGGFFESILARLIPGGAPIALPGRQ